MSVTKFHLAATTTTTTTRSSSSSSSSSNNVKDAGSGHSKETTAFQIQLFPPSQGPRQFQLKVTKGNVDKFANTDANTNGVLSRPSALKRKRNCSWESVSDSEEKEEEEEEEEEEKEEDKEEVVKVEVKEEQEEEEEEQEENGLDYSRSSSPEIVSTGSPVVYRRLYEKNGVSYVVKHPLMAKRKSNPRLGKCSEKEIANLVNSISDSDSDEDETPIFDSPRVPTTRTKLQRLQVESGNTPLKDRSLASNQPELDKHSKHLPGSLRVTLRRSTEGSPYRVRKSTLQQLESPIRTYQKENKSETRAGATPRRRRDSEESLEGRKTRRSSRLSGSESESHRVELPRIQESPARSAGVPETPRTSKRVQKREEEVGKYEDDEEEDEVEREERLSRRKSSRLPTREIPSTPTRKSLRSSRRVIPRTPMKEEEEEDDEEEEREREIPRTPRTPRTPRRAGPARTTPLRSCLTPKMNRRVGNPSTPLTPLQEARERLHVSAVPKSLPCREEEFNDIYTFLKGKLEDKCGGCMYISGVPGTGKTATVNEVIRCLKRLGSKQRVEDFTCVEINGMKLSEPRQAYVQIHKQLTGQSVTWEQAHRALDKRFSSPATNKKMTLLLVDELDLLCNKRQDVVYNILDWPGKTTARLIVITIANTMDLPERVLMGRVTSRLGLTRLTFQPYNFKQLQEIVMTRLNDFDAFRSEAVQLVARKVAAVSGDARRALDICRRSTEIAESRNAEIVTIQDVNKALTEMISSAKVQAIKHCSEMERVFLQAVCAEISRTGVEEVNFLGVYKQMDALCSFDGVKTPNVTQILHICSKLGASRLLITEHSKSDLYQRILLNVSADDVHYALQNLEVS